MMISKVHGQNTQQKFHIYAAADSGYFDQFAPALINSVLANTDQGLHLHLFNPRDDQIKQCQQPRISATWEYIDRDKFSRACQVWRSITEDQKRRTETAMTKGNDTDLCERLMRTYFACARFVRLHEQFHVPVFAIDIDAIVRKPIPVLGNNVDFHLHRIFGKKARCLAGGMYLNQQAENFLTAYALALRTQIEQDYLYWGLDQDVLDHIVPQYSHGQLPAELIDWNMTDTGIIWTAKGTRKDLEVFIAEKKKYSS
jgi:hypothetical protein